LSLINRSSTIKDKHIMKNLLITVAAATAFFATPAMAGDFAGPRVEVTAGADDVTGGVDTTDIAYGAGFGYDLQFNKVVVGAEVALDNAFDRRDVAVGARFGYVVNENVLAYTKAGYANWRQVAGASTEGLRLGGGLEVNLAGPLYGKVEYRYTDFEGGLGKHGGLVGVGIRF
jgi:outer membrane immunogenic protein